MCIAVQILSKSAKQLHLTISKWWPFTILDLKMIFEQHLGFGGPICVSTQNFVEIGGTATEI